MSRIDEFKNKIALLSTRFGASEITGKILAELSYQDNLSQKEISENINYSLSQISPALNELENLGIIKKIKIKGDREKKYVLQGTFAEFMIVAFSKIITQDLKPLIELGNELNVTEKKHFKDANKIIQMMETKLLLFNNMISKEIKCINKNK